MSSDFPVYVRSGEGADHARDNTHLEQALHQALQEGLFRVHYQPRVSVDGTFAGLEAFLRLCHPKLGDLPPDLFMPVAEARGLIVPIGSWALDEVCRQIAEWRARGFGEISVAINVSPVQIALPGFADELRNCLQRRNVSPTAVRLNIEQHQLLTWIG
jgi:EAL domain-containing protein (putative c-di-GMP-specific phosphodiesterase class I)